MNTSVTEIDFTPIKDLPSQYRISRTAFYNRLTALGIEPMKRGTKSYVTSRQLDLLNKLDHYMQQGGTMTDFLEMHSLSRTQTNNYRGAYSNTPKPIKEDPLPYTQLDDSYTQIGSSRSLALANGNAVQTVPVVLVTADALKALTYHQSSTFAPFDYLEKLEKCCECKWILSTSELSQLLGLSVKTITRYGESFQDSGFTFSRTGRKRAEVAWKVTK
ncbi:MAG TPA: hypothetical protein V6D03_04280 [Candidatus Caenarcaniphilales bacterium]|jgi:hypothetical protein